MTMFRSVLFVLLLSWASTANADPRCMVGTYRSPEGELLAISMSAEETRYTFLDGRRGSVKKGNTDIECHDRQLRTTGEDATLWQRVAFRQTVTHFESNGIRLFGRLVELPDADDTDTRPPLVVIAHGSENTSAASGPHDEPWAPIVGLLAAQGVSVFIFDKRGTGKSEGAFNMNFHRLADDVVAASHEAKRLAKDRYGRFGLIGFSQGGWVAPLAATKLDPDFLVVSYGALYSPLEEAWEEVRFELVAQGYDDEALADAEELMKAMANFRATDLREGYEPFNALRRTHQSETWFEVIRSRSDWAGHMAGSNRLQLRWSAGKNPLDIPWTHDGMDTARKLDVEQLWILAEEDHIAPIRLTLRRIEELRTEGKTIHTALFPRTDHGIIEFERAPDGARKYTRFAEGYFRLLADWAWNRRAENYGDVGF